MKKVKHPIMAAAEDESKLAQIIDQLEDDFEYAIAGFEKLDRTGSEESNKGYVIAQKLSQAITVAISEISDNM